VRAHQKKQRFHAIGTLSAIAVVWKHQSAGAQTLAQINAFHKRKSHNAEAICMPKALQPASMHKGANVIYYRNPLSQRAIHPQRRKPLVRRRRTGSHCECHSESALQK